MAARAPGTAVQGRRVPAQESAPGQAQGRVEAPLAEWQQPLAGAQTVTKKAWLVIVTVWLIIILVLIEVARWGRG